MKECCRHIMECHIQGCGVCLPASRAGVWRLKKSVSKTGAGRNDVDTSWSAMFKDVLCGYCVYIRILECASATGLLTCLFLYPTRSRLKVINQALGVLSGFLSGNSQNVCRCIGSGGIVFVSLSSKTSRLMMPWGSSCAAVCHVASSISASMVLGVPACCADAVCA